jgi:flagellar operon protein
MNQIGNSFTSIEQVAGQYLQQGSKTTQTGSENTVGFQDILQQKLTGTGDTVTPLKFSKHASMRLDQRDITLSAEQSERLEAGVQKAGEKGIEESLVIVDSLAFIVNVPNQTVVTAMDQSESMDNVFTNIDGAVII